MQNLGIKTNRSQDIRLSRPAEIYNSADPNYTYPVAEIKGADYDEICNWIGTNTITTLAAKTSPSESDLLEIRNRLASRPVLVTLYFYDPGIGVTSVTAPNGNKTTYTYDEFNKLATVKNDKGEIISSYSYNYKQ